MPSIMFDAVLIPGGALSAKALCGMGEAVHFVLEAYKHCKAICALNEGVQLLGSLGISQGKNPELITTPAAGVLVADARKVVEGQISQEFIAAIALHRHWERSGWMPSRFEENALTERRRSGAQGQLMGHRCRVHLQGPVLHRRPAIPHIAVAA